MQFEDFNLEYFRDFLIFRKLHIMDIHTQLYNNVIIIQWKQVKTTTFTINRLKFLKINENIHSIQQMAFLIMPILQYSNLSQTLPLFNLPRIELQL